MRVHVIGAHSTGKTTLVRWIARQYNLPTVTEVARQVLAERELSLHDLRHDVEVVERYQEAVWAGQVEAERRAGSRFVADRAFDALAYTAEHARGLHKFRDDGHFDAYMKSLRATDVFVFFLRPCRELLANDGVREVIAWEGVVRIDAMIKLLLEWWAIPYLPISTPSMQERTRTVEFVLRRWVETPVQ